MPGRTNLPGTSESNSLDVAQKLSSRNVKLMLQRRKKNLIKQIKEKWKTLQ
jgi:hypothetical protein